MTKETMTVHRALAELKLLDDRIDKAITSGVFCITNRHSNQKISGVSIDEYKQIIISNYDKASDLIKRREALKRAVAVSNATSKVKIGDKEYTRAEAIEMRNTGIEWKKALLTAMQRQYERAMADIKKNDGTLEERATTYVQGLYGGKDAKLDDESVRRNRDDFIKANTIDLVDPIKILDKIGALEDEIDTFSAEVDSALSVSNALTEITIEY